MGKNIYFLENIWKKYLCRDQRVSLSLTKVGPAVLNGGLSTLLAFILLSSSESYVCLSFFKIFFLICIFGLYNGLVALPVILSIAGPVPQVTIHNKRLM